MTNGILERLNAFKLRQRLPFYVQLAHACPEDLDDPHPQTVLIAITEIVRRVLDFLQWRHPVKRSSRRDFVRAFHGDREPPNAHEEAFLEWRKQCWKAKSLPEKSTVPPYMNLFPSVLRVLDEATEKFLADQVLSNDDLAWFENAIREGDESAEEEYELVRLEESMAKAQEHWVEDPPSYTVSEAVADGVLVDYPGYAPRTPDYAQDDYGEDEYEYYAEQYLYGADPDA